MTFAGGECQDGGEVEGLNCLSPPMSRLERIVEAKMSRMRILAILEELKRLMVGLGE